MAKMIEAETRLIVLFFVVSFMNVLCAEESVGLASGVTRNSSGEPVTESFSADKAVLFVEQSVAHWQQRRKCVTCHTNGLYLVAGAMATPNSVVLGSTQDFARSYLAGYFTGQVKPKGQHGAIEGMVSTSCFLAISEMTTNQRLDPKTISALDHIWEKQDESGSWPGWLKCHWGPFEVDDHYGVTLAAVALAMTPEPYRMQARPALAQKRLHGYLQSTPPSSAHQKAMMLWVDRYVSGIVDPKVKQQWVGDLRAFQQVDGGWALVDLGNSDWKREDAKAQHQGSDGYATALVIFALRQAGVPKNDVAIQRGIAWLKSHQRESGRWFTHSPRRDGKHYITQAATNMALLALASCGELPANLRPSK